MADTQLTNEGTIETAAKGRRNRGKNTKETKSCKVRMKPYLCEVCGIRFPIKSEYNRHFLTHTGEQPFQCHICEKRFSRSSILKDHINSHMILKPYICNVCNESFSSKRYLVSHVKNHPNEQTQPHVFEPGHYPITILTGTDGQRYECNICKRKFKSEHHIMGHLESFTGTKMYNCELCGMGFLTRHKFESHLQNVHKNECSFKCFMCNMEFPQQDYLTDHIKNTHTSPALKPFKCKECNSEFRAHWMLKAHMITHTNERPFICPKCSKTFQSARTLKQHAKRHNEASFSCHQCLKVFKVKADLQKHHQIHKVDRGHVCQHCGVRIANKTQFEVHLRRHAGEEKLEESLGNELYPISQRLHNLYINTNETEVNANNQDNTDEMLQIQDTLESSLSPAVDTKDIFECGNLASDVQWIDCQSFSILNGLDSSLLGEQNEQPEAVVAESLAEKENMITSPPDVTGEGTYDLLELFPLMDQNQMLLPLHIFSID